MKRIGPFGSLVDPRSYGGDLLRTERTGWRHLQPVFCSNQPVIEKAVFAADWNHAPYAVLKNGASSVEPQPIHLLGRAVTTEAVLPHCL